MANALLEIPKLGQSVWYDNIRRGLITSGELAKMVRDDALMGLTSNPAIFEKAIAGSSDYDQALKDLLAKGHGNAKDIFEQLAVEDIQMAADVMATVFERTHGRDGFVSLEVSPYLAHDTQATIEEARRLRAAVARDNVMIKVPATPEGISAIRQLITEGININVTLLFAVEAYEAVANAYMEGLEARAAKREDLSNVASVASFFVSRIDTLVDEKLSKLIEQTSDAGKQEKLRQLPGKTAIANAKIAYARYQKLYASERWKALAAKGAKTQRLLWGSTSTKNPTYSKTLYVDELIGPDTVNTMPPETIIACRDSGRPRASLTERGADNLRQAEDTLRTLTGVGISLKEVTDALLVDAVKKFADPFDKLLISIEKKRQAMLGGRLAQQAISLGNGASAVQAAQEEWRAKGNVRRLWNKDASLWTGKDENQWLGWLDIVAAQRANADEFQKIAEEIRSASFKDAVVLGMGGSSLCPEVLAKTFGPRQGFPKLHVLDSTVPAQIKALERQIEPVKTVFIIASKSGGTIEPNMLKHYFFEKVRAAVGAANAGSHFIAITDPGTKMEKIAREEHFRHILYGQPTVGGRFSALSNFGMMPAAIMGVDVQQFLDRTDIMVQSCAGCVPPEVNPGVTLGLILGALAKQGRDKVTFITSPAIASLGTWLEQMLAESLGKQGKGLVPIDNETIGPPEVYGNDRLFVYLRLAASASPEQDSAVTTLEKAGHPIVRITLEKPQDLGQEIFRWEIATAVAGSVLGINPFDQPDVESAKVAARKFMTAYEETGKLPTQTPLVKDGDLSLYADPRNADALKTAVGDAKDAAAYVKAHLARLRPGDYFAVNAFLKMNEANDRELQAIRHAVRDARHVATTLGYGPRFLHSTGQLHKGGPNTGVFLHITSDDAEDLPIPGQKFTFGVLKQAQAQGDFEVLAERGRRLLRVHLGPDVPRGLAQLREILS